MPGGLTYVLLAPAQTCTRLPDRDPLTCAKSENKVYGIYFTPNLVRRARRLLEQWTDNRVCFAADRLVVIVFFRLHIFWLFLPRKESLSEAGSYPRMPTYGTPQEACLSVFSSWVTACDLGGGWVMGWGGSGGLRFAVLRLWMSGAANLGFFEVLTAMSANSPAPLGWDLFDAKKKKKKKERNRKRSVKGDVR